MAVLPAVPLLFALAASAVTAASPKPNLIFALIDDFGAPPRWLTFFAGPCWRCRSGPENFGKGLTPLP